MAYVGAQKGSHFKAFWIFTLGVLNLYLLCRAAVRMNDTICLNVLLAQSLARGDG